MKNDFIDLKYVNSNILLFKIGKIKFPAYMLLFLLIMMIFQNRYAVFISFLLMYISIIMETKKETIKTISYKISYIFKKRFLLPTNNKSFKEKKFL
jgi:hypothetical protein